MVEFSEAVPIDCSFLSDCCLTETYYQQVPVLGVQVKMLPVAFSVFGFMLQLKSNFTVIFMEGGIGKNKSTVAVSLLFCLNCWMSCLPIAHFICLCVCVCVCVFELDSGFMNKLFLVNWQDMFEKMKTCQGMVLSDILQ